MTPFGNNSQETSGPFGGSNIEVTGPFGNNENGNEVTPETLEVSTGSLDEIITSFRESENFRLLGYADYLENLKRGLNQENLESLSGVLSKFASTESIDEIEEIMNELHELSTVFQDEINVQRDTSNQEELILSDRYLDEIDFLGMLRPSINDKLESSEDMSLEELIEAARDIELTGEINGQESWDALFADLRNKVNESDLIEFDKQVELFKTEEQATYEANIDTSSIGGSLDEQLASIESGEWDSQFEAGTARINIDVQSMLGGAVEALGITDNELSNLLDVGPFSDKEVAVRTIYKLKLIFKEMEENGKNFLSYYYEYVNNTALWLGTEGGEQMLNGTIDMAPGGDSIVQTPFHWIAGAVLTSLGVITGIVGNALPTGVTLFFMGTPLESAWRRIKDRIAVWIGDKGFAAPIRNTSNAIRSGRQWIGGQARAGLAGTFSAEPGKLRRLGNIARLAGGTGLWVPAKGVDLLLGGFGSLVEGAERIHLDAANLLTDRILLVDGLSGGVGDTGLDNATSNEAIEIRSRVKMLALWKQMFEYEGNTQALDRLNSIAKGSLFANSESFYIDLHRLIVGSIGSNSSSARWRRFGIDVSNIMLIPNKKEAMVKLYLEYMEKTSGMLGQVYNNVRFENNRETPNSSRIDLPENRSENYTNFVRDMMADIDLTLISDSDEKAREKILLDFFSEMERGGVGILSADEVKFEIEKITEGFLPNYKIIQEIVQKRSTLSEGSDGLKNIEDLRRLVLAGDWYGTQADLDRILSDISRTPAIEHKPVIRNMEDVRQEGEDLRALSLRNRSDTDFSRMTDINTYSHQLSIIEHLIDMGEMGGNITEIRRQLAALLANAKDNNLKIDYTIPQFNFAIEQILSGKRFSDSGIGDFGTGTDLDTMRTNFSDFDIQVSDRLETRLLDNLPGQNQEIRIKTIDQILGNNSFSHLQRTDKFRNIVQTLETEVRSEIDIIKTQLEDLRQKRSALYRTVTSNENSGESNNIGELNQEIGRKISDLQTRLQNSLNNRGTTVIDRVNIVESFPAEIVSLEQKISALEVDIEQYNSRSPSTETITPSAVEETTEPERVTPTTTEESPVESTERVSSRPRGVEVFFDGEELRSNGNARALYAVSFQTGISLGELREQIPADTTGAGTRDAINNYLAGKQEYRMLTTLSEDDLRSMQIDLITRASLASGKDINPDIVERVIRANTFISHEQMGNILDIEISNVPEWDTVLNTIENRVSADILHELREVSNAAWRRDGVARWRAILDVAKRIGS